MGLASKPSSVALVLAGGAARGAYEVGVVAHVVEEVSRELGYDAPLDILSGTSVGAINACALAAFADAPRERAQKLVDVWARLRVDELIQPDLRGVVTVGERWLRPGRASTSGRPSEGRGLIRPQALERLIAREIPFARIDENLRRGHLAALTVSTTHVASGRTVVYVQRPGLDLPPWSHDPTVLPRAARITAQHTFASAAIPILFRPVKLDGEYHCDGGLRQNVPLSPARRLGARGILVVSPRFIKAPAPAGELVDEPAPGQLSILGKALNALLLDRVDADLARLEGINELLEAGRRVYGDDFGARINQALGFANGHGLGTIRTVLVRASEDLGRMAARYARSPAFARRTTSATARLFARLAEREAADGSDLLSYLLFDGGFAAELIELGRADARARHAELCQFFEAMREAAAPEAERRAT